VLTQIQQQPLNGTNLAANTSPYPIALFSLTDPVVLQVLWRERVRGEGGEGREESAKKIL
jgi:hypothetical protein